MKLTKGKISKLYNKKNQSFKKKINRKKGASKRKTFRKNKKYNLAKKTLKRFYSKKRGGEGPIEDPKIVDTSVTPSAVEEVPSTPITGEDLTVTNVEEVTPITSEEVPGTPITSEDVTVSNVDVNALPDTSVATEGLTMTGSPASVEQEVISPTVPVTPVTGEDVTVTKVDINALPDTSVATEGLTEPGSPPPPTFENNSSLQVEEKEPTNISDSQQQISSETTPQIEENIDTSVKSEEEISNPGISSSQDNISSGSEPNNKLTEALSTIVEVLSEKVASKVANELGSGSSKEKVQNGFDSVATAAENMSGGKKRKSRKFRLHSKGKSRKQQK
jgi:hypothetical protein